MGSGRPSSKFCLVDRRQSRICLGSATWSANTCIGEDKDVGVAAFRKRDGSRERGTPDVFVATLATKTSIYKDVGVTRSREPSP